MACRWMLALALVSACYAPHEPLIASGDESSATDDSSSTTLGTSSATGPSTSTVGDETTASDGPATETASETGADLPPELSNFSVNGSDAPSEILEADLVEIQVAATDDVGIDRVEFYDGDTLIATFTEPPYHTEFLVTSADNGGHSYTAIAYDTAEQNDQEGPIPLSISIDGGAVVELQGAGFEVTSILGTFSPVLAAIDDTLFVVGTNRFEGADFTRFRLATSRLTLGLSNTGTTYFPTAVTASSSHHEYGGRGTRDDDGNLLLPVNLRPNGGNAVLHLLRLQASNGAASTLASFGAESEGAAGGAAALIDGGLAAATAPERVEGYAAAGDAAVWTTDVSAGISGDPRLTTVVTDLDGAVIVAGMNGTDAFVRKLSTDGDILWTRSADDVAQMYDAYTAFAAVSSTGEVCLAVTVSVDDGQGLRLLTYDGDGAMLDDVVVAAGTPLFLTDVSYDPQGRIVLSANQGDASVDAWLGRYETDGTPIWSGAIYVGSSTATATDIVVRSDGRLYATGLRDTVAEFLAMTGPVWVAEIAL